MNPHVSVITLGVRDFAGAKRFYSEGLGWTVHLEDENWASFFLNDGKTALALYPWDELAADADVESEGKGFRGVTFAYNVRSEDRVHAVLAEAERAGGTVVQQPRQREWGGFSGYFADPEGYLWEVATGAKTFPFSE